MKNLFILFLKIWSICTLSSFIPLGYIGVAFGSPSVLVASIALTYFFKEKRK